MKSYKARLHHHLFPIGAIVVSAIVCALLPTWQTIIAFVVITGISVFISRWIMIIGVINAEEDYWMYVGSSIEKLKKAEPEIWAALGFKEVPIHATIETTVREAETPEHTNPYHTSRYDGVPISPVRLQVFADGILSGRKTLSEGSWKGVIPGPKYREFQDWMEDKNLIAKVNPEARTQGYILTETGETWLLEHASPNIKNGVGGMGYKRVIPVRADAERV